MEIRGYGEVKLEALSQVLRRWRSLESGLGIATLTLSLPAASNVAATVPLPS